MDEHQAKVSFTCREILWWEEVGFMKLLGSTNWEKHAIANLTRHFYPQQTSSTIDQELRRRCQLCRVQDARRTVVHLNHSQVNRSLIKSWRFPYTYFTLSIMSVDSGLIFKRALKRKVQQSVCFWKRPLIQQLSATGNKTEQICSRISTMAICKLLCTVSLYYAMVTDISGTSSTSGLQH